MKFVTTAYPFPSKIEDSRLVLIPSSSFESDLKKILIDTHHFFNWNSMKWINAGERTSPTQAWKSISSKKQRCGKQEDAGQVHLFISLFKPQNSPREQAPFSSVCWVEKAETHENFREGQAYVSKMVNTIRSYLSEDFLKDMSLKVLLLLSLSPFYSHRANLTPNTPTSQKLSTYIRR